MTDENSFHFHLNTLLNNRMFDIIYHNNLKGEIFCLTII